jgi:hypothetical protein
MKMRLNDYLDTATCNWRLIRQIYTLFVGVDEERSLQDRGGYTRRIPRSKFGCCCPHKEK